MSSGGANYFESDDASDTEFSKSRYHSMPSATETTSIVFRDVAGTAEIKALEDLQIAAWGDDERDVVPLNQFVAVRHVGGSLIGAFDDKKLVGFVYGFYGHVCRQIVHHSHMLAVDPAYRNHDLGFRLKAAQRDRVLADGLTGRITWTFDPLQSLNAHFNFAKLGVLSDTYKVNVYGEQGTSFLHRNGTDRLFVTWMIDSPRVEGLMARKQSARANNAVSRPKAVRLLRNSDSGRPEADASIKETSAMNFVAIEIPADINSIERADFDLARNWREQTRRVFSEAFSEGFVIVGYFLENERTGSYLLERTRLDAVG
jgi:predicted GNAT superfamily acetyltransferase